jgi:ribosomal protein L29
MAKKDNHKGKTVDELKKLLGEKRASLESFRFNVSGSKVKNIKEAKNTRRDAARILTELNNQKATK